MASLNFWNIREQFVAILQMGGDILTPLLLGSMVVGIITGIVAYIFSLQLLSIFLSRRAQKRLLNHRKKK